VQRVEQHDRAVLGVVQPEPALQGIVRPVEPGPQLEVRPARRWVGGELEDGALADVRADLLVEDIDDAARAEIVVELAWPEAFATRGEHAQDGEAHRGRAYSKRCIEGG
jgi:hypothetical protein